MSLSALAELLPMRQVGADGRGIFGRAVAGSGGGRVRARFAPAHHRGGAGSLRRRSSEAMQPG